MKKIIIFGLAFILLAVSVSAYCCSNPLSSIPFCEKINLQEELAKELCCPDNEYYGIAKNSPTSKIDCEQRFFSEECNDNCELGCCFDLNSYLCSENTAKSFCQGFFSTEFGGKCEENNLLAIKACETGCCCSLKMTGIATRPACIGGSFTSGIDNYEECRNICKKQKCVDGCQIKKPLYCEDSKLYYDCTGGDKIVGNGNDCGCPEGKTCKPNGICEEKKDEAYFEKNYKSEKSCTSKGANWCEIEGKCVKSCENCGVSIEKDNICTDVCEEITCGGNSYCSNGECLCETEFFDEECRLYGGNMDYDKMGCYKRDPCKSPSQGLGPWFLIAVFLLLIFILMIFFMRKKNPPKQTHEDEYPINYPNYPSYPR